jgi:hypothetical protein
MTNETTDNFWAVVNTLPPFVPQPIFYRLYHDDRGKLLFYSMEDIPGNYIEIDQETFAESPSKVQVVNGQLTRVNNIKTTKLTPSTTGITCDIRDICVLVVESQPHTKWNIKTYESN